MTAEPDEVDPLPEAEVVNVVTGTVAGTVIQARDITGDIHL